MKVPNPALGRTQSSGEPLAYLSARGGTPQAFGSAIGEGLQSLGQELGNVSDDQFRLEAAFNQRQKQADRFDTLSRFNDWQRQVSDQVSALKQASPPDGTGYTRKTSESYGAMEQSFLGTVPPEMQEEMKYRTSEVRKNVLGDAVGFQLTQQNAFQRTKIDDAYNGYKVGLDPRTGGNPQYLAGYSRQITELIQNSTLAPAEKDKMLQEKLRGLEGISYGQAITQAVLGATGVDGAKQLIREQEGFKDSAYYDVNAYRTGYGSDTITNEDGSVTPVSQATRTDKAGAERDLTRRVTEFQTTAAEQVGTNTWMALPANVQAGLTSVTYNYGSLPNSVVQAVRTGSVPAIAQAVASLSSNPERRQQEAQVILGQKAIGTQDVDADPQYSNVPYEDRVAMTADAQQAAVKQNKDDAAAHKAQQDSYRDNLYSRLQFGDGGQADIDAGVQGGQLDYEAHKKAQDILDTRNKTGQALQQYTIKASDPSAIWTNEDQKLINAKFADEQGPDKLGSMDRDYVSNVMLPAFNQIKDLPSDAVATLGTMTRSNDTQKTMFAYDTLRQLQQANPQAFDNRVPGDLAKNLDIYNAGKDLYPQDELVRRINGSGTMAERQGDAVIRQEGKDFLSKSVENVPNSVNLINDIVKADYPNNWFSPDPTTSRVPWVQGQMQAEANEHFLQAYVGTRDVAKATEIAAAAIKRDWGMSTVSGKPVIMKMPPEQAGYRPLGGSFDYIGQEVRETLALAEGENFELVSDDRTQREFSAWQRNTPPAVPKFEDDQTPIPPVQAQRAKINAPYTKPGLTDADYNTKLSPGDETTFRNWVKENDVPFDPDKTVSDYDMRGYWKGLTTGDPKATQGVDPNDNALHYTDYWKTPYHETFSRESKFATGNAPHWQGDKLIDQTGRVLYDDKAPKWTPELIKDAPLPSYQIYKVDKDGNIRDSGVRMNFAPKPQDIADDFARKNWQSEMTRVNNVVGEYVRAQKYEQYTGIKIPEDLQRQYEDSVKLSNELLKNRPPKVPEPAPKAGVEDLLKVF